MINWYPCCVHLLCIYIWVDFDHCWVTLGISSWCYVIIMCCIGKIWLNSECYHHLAYCWSIPNNCVFIFKLPLSNHSGKKKFQRMCMHVRCFCDVHKSFVDHGCISIFSKAVINQVWRDGIYLHDFLLIINIACPLYLLIHHMPVGKACLNIFWS